LAIVFAYYQNVFSHLRSYAVYAASTISSSKTSSEDLLDGSADQIHASFNHINASLATSVYSSGFNLSKFNVYAKSSFSKTRIVLMTPSTKVGFSNMMYAFMTSLFIAITKKTTLFVEWPHIESFIMVPVENVHFNNYKLLSNYTKANRKLKSLKVDFSPVNTWKSVKNASVINQSLPSNYDMYTVVIFHPWFFELATDPAHFDTLSRLNLVSKSLIKKANLLYKMKNKDNKVMVETLYALGFSFAHNVLNHVLVVKDPLRAYIDKYVRDNFENYYVIGMQMRQGFMDNVNDVRNFLNCTMRHHEHARFKFNIPEKSIKWFLATDNEQLSGEIRARFPDRVLTVEGKVGHVIYETVFYNRAIVDNELLSKCNELIITGGSTFGSVAVMRAGRMPLFFNPNANTTHCPRMTFSDLPKRGDFGYSIFRKKR
jgi:hypothetical protein